MTSVTIPNSVNEIEKDAFYNCDQLAKVELGRSVRSIGDEAFASCDNLSAIRIPNSVRTIGRRAFFGCNKLVYAVIARMVFSIGEDAFNSPNLRNVVIGRRCYKKFKGQAGFPSSAVIRFSGPIEKVVDWFKSIRI